MNRLMRGGLPGRVQEQGHARPAFGAVRRSGPAAVSFRGGPDDGQAEPGPLTGPGLLRGASGERVNSTGQEGGIEPGAGVLDGQPDGVAVAGGADADLPAAWGVPGALLTTFSTTWRTSTASTKAVTPYGTTRTSTPAADARAARAEHAACKSSSNLACCRCSGTRPPSAREKTSSVSASTVRRSASSAALRTAACSSWLVLDRDCARSSSAFKTASGVRSPWLASSTNRRSRSVRPRP